MRILLKSVLDSPVDASWRAIRDPDVFRAVSRPFTTFQSLETGGFPASWSEGAHPVRASTLGGIILGEQTIDLTFVEREDGVRMVRDTGRGLTGPLAAVSRWNHTMAVSATTDGRTLYRDRLIVEVGSVTAAAWPGFWAFWQWRGIQLKRLAPGWK